MPPARLRPRCGTAASAVLCLLVFSSAALLGVRARLVPAGAPLVETAPRWDEVANGEWRADAEPWREDPTVQATRRVLKQSYELMARGEWALAAERLRRFADGMPMRWAMTHVVPAAFVLHALARVAAHEDRPDRALWLVRQALVFYSPGVVRPLERALGEEWAAEWGVGERDLLLDVGDMTTAARRRLQGPTSATFRAPVWPGDAAEGQRRRDVGLVTLCDYDGSRSRLSGWSARNRVEYARRNAYPLYFETRVFDRRRHPAWAKVPALARHLGKHEWLAWVDCDSFVTNHSRRFEDVLATAPADAQLLISDDGMGANSGVFLLRNSPWGFDFLRRVYGADPEWLEEATMGGSRTEGESEAGGGGRDGGIGEGESEGEGEGGESGMRGVVLDPMARYASLPSRMGTVFLDHPQWEQAVIQSLLYRAASEADPWLPRLAWFEFDAPDSTTFRPGFPSSAAAPFSNARARQRSTTPASTTVPTFLVPRSSKPPSSTKTSSSSSSSSSVAPSFASNANSAPSPSAFTSSASTSTRVWRADEAVRAVHWVPQRWINGYPPGTASHMFDRQGVLTHTGHAWADPNHGADFILSFSGCTLAFGAQACDEAYAETAQRSLEQ